MTYYPRNPKGEKSAATSALHDDYTAEKRVISRYLHRNLTLLSGGVASATKSTKAGAVLARLA
jgi:hypothetical protein